MKASYNKLQDYLDEKLPSPKDVAKALTFHSYEVGNFEEVNGDYIFDIEILPNRVGDSKDEEGVARELSAVLNIPLGGGVTKWRESDIKINISIVKINKLLGSNISLKEVEDILKRLKFKFELNNEVFTITTPVERTDLKVGADIIEEIGRIYGYENIKAIFPEKFEKSPKINKKFYYTTKIKNFLIKEGFSEVYTYTFRDNGDIKIIKPVASDKNFLRANLRDGIEKALEQNVKNIPLLNIDQVKVFEIGNVFTKDKEYTSFAMTAIVSSDLQKKDDKYIDVVINRLSDILGTRLKTIEEGGVFEINFDELLEKLPEPEGEYEKSERNKIVKYKPISQYPFILRDIAVWVPSDTPSDNVLNLIKENGTELLVNTRLFDEFKKDDMTSYAFNLVFQSQEKTLSDHEINKIMDTITESIESNNNWKVR